MWRHIEINLITDTYSVWVSGKKVFESASLEEAEAYADKVARTDADWPPVSGDDLIYP